MASNNEFHENCEGYFGAPEPLRKVETACVCNAVRSAMILVEVWEGKKKRQEWQHTSKADPQYCKACKTFTHEANVKGATDA